MYRIALCDDHKDYLEQLETKVREYCEEHEIETAIQSFDDSDSLLEHVEEQKMHDVYILDIEMPGCSGMTLARNIKKRTGCAFIIFLTAHENYAMESCEIGLFRYILKEQLKYKLSDTLSELFHQLNQVKNNRVYVIGNQRRYVKLWQHEILYIYKNQKNAIFVLQDGTEEWERITIQNVYAKLDNPDMFLLDRGVIVNLRNIQKIADGRIKMGDGREIKTTIAHLSELKKKLGKYWGARL